MTSGKLGFWPTYPTQILYKIIYDNLINIFDLPHLQKFGQIPEKFDI